MNIKTYNAATIGSGRSSKPSLRVNGRAGLFSLSIGFVDSTSWSANYIAFHQDEDKPANWYMEPTDNETGFKLREDKSSKQLSFNCSALARHILTSLGKLQSDSYSIPLAVQPSKIGDDKVSLEAYALLTRAVIDTK